MVSDYYGNDWVKQNLSDFKATVYRNFVYLAKFGYAIVESDFGNEFTVKYSNGKTSIIVEGINWGLNVLSGFDPLIMGLLSCLKI